MTSYFTPDFAHFFKELAANNHKEWFDENRKRYEKEVKNPFAAFVADLILAMRVEEPEILVEPKDCIFRINRDIRFSKDKTPYKTQASALISVAGKSQKASPGLYIEFGPEKIAVYGGIYEADAALLKDVRLHIAENLVAFKAAYTNQSFVKTYTCIRGEKNKRLDSDFLVAAAREPLLFNKQFYYNAHLPTSLYTSPDLLPSILNAYHAAEPVRNFLRQAIA